MVKGGYRWGQHGHVYKTRAGAERQARAAYANGYRGDSLQGPDRALQFELERLALVGSDRYMRELRGLMRSLHRAVLADLRPFFALYSGRRHDGGIGDLASRVGHFVSQVASKVGRFFRRMASAVVAANRTAMGLLLGRPPADPPHSVIAAAQAESERLVARAAYEYADQIRDVLAAGAKTEEALVTALEARGAASESKAVLIARDQTLKLGHALNRAAQEAAGYTKYYWLTCRDDRVRKTHNNNLWVVFAWSEPSPITGHPGHDPNCRCTPIPYDGPLAPGERV